ncbi:hypothetical protein AgCh_014441 [Apium graveolens]
MHIVMFSIWSLATLLELAMLIRGHRISLISTPRNIERLPKVPSDLKENVSDQYRFAMSIQNCDMVAIRSSVEFEPECLNLVEEIQGKCLVPVGFLPAEESSNYGGDESWGDIKDWLDMNSIKIVFLSDEPHFFGNCYRI